MVGVRPPQPARRHAKLSPGWSAVAGPLHRNGGGWRSTSAVIDDAAWLARLSGIARAPALWLGAACFVVHLVANAHYDVFRDELYFIVCGLHPAFGYVDQPPLIPLIAAASYKLFGTALTPLRLVPALATATTVALTADLARRLGGGRFAQTLAGLCVLLAPALSGRRRAADDRLLQPLTWLACAWILLRLVESGDERWWLAFGAVVGVSLESKYLIASTWSRSLSGLSRRR